MDKRGFRSVEIAVTYALLFGTIIRDVLGFVDYDFFLLGRCIHVRVSNFVHFGTSTLRTSDANLESMFPTNCAAGLLEAAKRSRPNFHAQNLVRGGEFLSPVCMLMAHLGSGSQYEVEGLDSLVAPAIASSQPPVRQQ
ncbi:hypothetical protein RND71_034025 [Anisodus tanguticus]|uniref:Uncharacterized protein n=1 Tax=Anisodus tanguticus TaxID=243964 RepID=A0AAE1R9D1_9SOLA|nr:hypothetical protein RND71_034025 [Anisodus tanguticus]